jgi:hypothetical protein
VNLGFDLSNIDVVEFGVGLYTDEGEEFSLVPVGQEVQDALKDMVMATKDAMDHVDGDPEVYEPSEKYESEQYIRLPLDHEYAAKINMLYTAENLNMSADALNDPSRIYCYFTRIRGTNGKRLVALRRSTQFKGVLKSRLIRFLTDAMQLVHEPMFKLDRDFDMLVDGSAVHILRPNAFEIIAKLGTVVLQAVTANIAFVQEDLPFIDFTVIQEYATGHARAARNLAALRTNDKTKNIDRDFFIAMCASTGVPLKEKDGKISVDRDNVVGFLEVLDRRRYEVKLVADAPEPYKASSRKRIG